MFAASAHEFQDRSMRFEGAQEGAYPGRRINVTESILSETSLSRGERTARRMDYGGVGFHMTLGGLSWRAGSELPRGTLAVLQGGLL